MAVVNQYKFAGLNANTDNTEKNPFGTNNPLVSETYIIKSINIFYIITNRVKEIPAIIVSKSSCL